MTYEAELTDHYAGVRRRLYSTDVEVASKPRNVRTIYVTGAKRLIAPPPKQAFKPKPQKVKPIQRDLINVTEGGTHPFVWRLIVDEVCTKYQCTFGEIIGGQRAKWIVVARHEAFYRLSKETALSLPQIGRLMGGKDHTTVLHGCRKHASRLLEALEQAA